MTMAAFVVRKPCRDCHGTLFLVEADTLLCPICHDRRARMDRVARGPQRVGPISPIEGA